MKKLHRLIALLPAFVLIISGCFGKAQEMVGDRPAVSIAIVHFYHPGCFQSMNQLLLHSQVIVSVIGTRSSHSSTKVKTRSTHIQAKNGWLFAIILLVDNRHDTR